MTGRAKSRSEATVDSGAEILQFKIWLKGVSPMIWRRVQVPTSMTLCELHGVFQVAMGWEGIHLFMFDFCATHFGSSELGCRSPSISPEDLKLRKGARFIYEYDLNVPWEHEVRLEAGLHPAPGRTYPHCIDGHEACPPEDCGGPADFLEQHEAWCSSDGLTDLATVANFVDQVVLKERIELLKGDILLEEMRNLLERAEVRRSWQGSPFSRKAVKERLKDGDHLDLMHQQW